MSNVEPMKHRPTRFGRSSVRKPSTRNDLRRHAVRTLAHANRVGVEISWTTVREA